MALVLDTLKRELKNLVSNSDNFPDSFAGAAQNFANALNEYGKMVVPSSVSSEAAKAAFVSAFIASQPKQSLEIVVDGVVAYCVALAVGMAPVWVGTPPPSSTSLLAAMIAAGQIALDGGSSDDWANSAASAIDTYFRTGTATNSTTGVVVIWS